MNLKSLNDKVLTITLASDEVTIINNSLNEIANGVRLDKDDFAARKTITVEDVSELLDEFSKLGRTLLDKTEPENDYDIRSKKEGTIKLPRQATSGKLIEVISIEPEALTLKLTSHNIAVINGALSEIVHGPYLDDQDFATRVGYTKEEASALLDSLNKLAD